MKATAKRPIKAQRTVWKKTNTQTLKVACHHLQLTPHMTVRQFCTHTLCNY